MKPESWYSGDSAARVQVGIGIAVPFAIHLFVMQGLWFNAPIWDDYLTVLDVTLRLGDAGSLAEWLNVLLPQHNEHRIAVTRLIARMFVLLTGEIDFRWLMFTGSLMFLGAFIFIIASLPSRMNAVTAASAGFLMFQWSYWEASLMGSACIPHIGVVLFSFGCLWFACRPGGLSVAAAVACGLLASGSQANGLFALPVATIGCILLGMRSRAAAYGSVALLVWLLYFWGYSRPPNHPSPFVAISDPIFTMKLLLVVLGGIVPGWKAPIFVGALVVAGLAWLTWRGFWKSHHELAMFSAFLLISAAAVTAGRAGFGPHHASRYAVVSTCLVVILAVSISSMPSRWTPRAAAIALALAISASAAISWRSWPQVRENSVKGHLLSEVESAEGARSDARYFGINFPHIPTAIDILARSERQKIYLPPRQIIYPAAVVAAEVPPPTARTYGFVDEVVLNGRVVTVAGWTDITATTRHRKIVVAPSRDPRNVTQVNVGRDGVALQLKDRELLFSGFRLVLEYASEQEATNAARDLCVFVEAPGRPLTRLNRAGAACA